MTEPTIPPALTPLEWEQDAWASHGEYAAPLMASQLARHGSHLFAGRHHALAALCLYQQPFGFTQEDVAWLLNEAHTCDVMARGAERSEPSMREHFETRATKARSLASRIASLLPPPETP